MGGRRKEKGKEGNLEKYPPSLPSVDSSRDSTALVMSQTGFRVIDKTSHFCPVHPVSKDKLEEWEITVPFDSQDQKKSS